MSFVLITGASSGLGTEYARQLAQRGHNLILTARRSTRLSQLACELEQLNSVTVKTITADLSADGVEIIINTLSKQDWCVHGLINNAGFGQRSAFKEMNYEHMTNMLQVNITSVVQLTHQLLTQLASQPQPFIINLASTAAFQSGPYAAVYYASKAFVLSFSEALYTELKKTGIRVSCVCPGPTETEFSAKADMQKLAVFKYMSMTAKSVVRISLQHINKPVVIAGYRNRLLRRLSSIVPRRLQQNILSRFQK